MQILPNHERFTEIIDDSNKNAEYTNFSNFVTNLPDKEKEEIVSAKSDSRVALQKLQDDLRKAGYKNIK